MDVVDVVNDFAFDDDNGDDNDNESFTAVEFCALGEFELVDVLLFLPCGLFTFFIGEDDEDSRIGAPIIPLIGLVPELLDNDDGFGDNLDKINERPIGEFFGTPACIERLISCFLTFLHFTLTEIEIIGLDLNDCGYTALNTVLIISGKIQLSSYGRFFNIVEQ